MTQCPCHSGLPYSDCCQGPHSDTKRATTPQALMRSRFSAHVLKLIDYVVDTYHPSCNAAAQRDDIAESIALNWCALTVHSEEHDEGSNEGFVDFEAMYIDSDVLYSMRERSRFLKEGDGRWYYIDGTFSQAETPPQKLKRNDPCPCGSGKKFKKCCAS